MMVVVVTLDEPVQALEWDALVHGGGVTMTPVPLPAPPPTINPHVLSHDTLNPLYRCAISFSGCFTAPATSFAMSQVWPV